MRIVVITHFWISGSGWEPLIYAQDELIEITHIAFTDNGEDLFTAYHEKRGQQMLMGHYRILKP